MKIIPRSKMARRPIALLACLAAAAPAAAADSPSPERTAQLADLAVVRTQYLPKEMAYSPAARAMAALALDRLERDAGKLSPLQFAIGLAELGALTDNAHSGLRIIDARAKPQARLPLRLLWLDDALIVARATGAAADLAGARVVKIEGRSPAAMYAGAKVLLGGNDAGRKHWLNDWIESAGVLHALGLAKEPDTLALTLRLVDGRTIDRSIDMVPAKDLPPTAELERLWSPEPIAGEHGWTAALGTGDLPLYLQDANRPFRAVPLPDKQALYVQFRSNEDEKDFPIAKFTDEVRKTIADTHPPNLIVDLRFDVGGNLLTTLDFMRQVPSLAGKHTWLLVGPYTFSAGIISAAAIEKHGGNRVTLLGEPIGDRLHFWSEGANIPLPNSHLSFRYTNGQFDLANGCTGAPACMDDMYPINVNGVSLDPDIPARLDAEAYFGKADPAMDAVAKDIAARAGVTCATETAARVADKAPRR